MTSTPSRPLRARRAVWKSTSASGAHDNSSLSHFSAITRPSWLGRAARNRHRHAIGQASRRWRGGRLEDSARTRRKILIFTQVLTRYEHELTVQQNNDPTLRRLQLPFIRAVGAILPEATTTHDLRQRSELRIDLQIAACQRLGRLDAQRRRERQNTLKVNDCRARQARRRALKDQLPALFRAHGFYRPEIVRHVLTYVGFDLPGGRLTG